MFGPDALRVNVPHKPLVKDDEVDPGAFATAFEERYGPLRPQFMCCQFRDALAFSGDVLKPVLLYLHDVRAFPTNIFCRSARACPPVITMCSCENVHPHSTVLTDPDVVRLISENFVCFGWDMTTDAGRNQLLAASKPHVKLSRTIESNYPELIGRFG